MSAITYFHLNRAQPGIYVMENQNYLITFITSIFGAWRCSCVCNCSSRNVVVRLCVCVCELPNIERTVVENSHHNNNNEFQIISINFHFLFSLSFLFCLSLHHLYGLSVSPRGVQITIGPPAAIISNNKLLYLLWSFLSTQSVFIVRCYYAESTAMEMMDFNFNILFCFGMNELNESE